MYVFDYSAELYDIEQALGIPFPDFVQFKRRIVFLKNGKIVYREDQPTNIEKHLDGEVFFDIPDTEVYRQYTPETAIFRVEKRPFTTAPITSLNRPLNSFALRKLLKANGGL